MAAWPCIVAATSAMVPPEKTRQTKSFVQVLHDSCEVQVSQLPSPVIKGDSLYIKITQEEYMRKVSLTAEEIFMG
ncbi:unnamed protein product [Trifolium pratense]|uniref:Uncharacterized protein n=1 Tax=Trifolium pratense TaxID=57577 RepID=A0ACB0LEZ7_TRIPR|nr:unnamed protein product [Trifolium pratense]